METLPTGRQAVAVLGAGNMGTAVAQVIAGNGRAVRLWSIETDVLEEVRDRRRNSKYLDGLPLHPSIEAFWGLSEAVHGARLVIINLSPTPMDDRAAIVIRARAGDAMTKRPGAGSRSSRSSRSGPPPALGPFRTPT